MLPREKPEEKAESFLKGLKPFLISWLEAQPKRQTKPGLGLYLLVDKRLSLQVPLSTFLGLKLLIFYRNQLLRTQISLWRLHFFRGETVS